MARNRIIYASQSVWANGEVLYRVQSLGSTTTFTSEDIFELGHLDIIDVVDDVPAVAVTLNTNDFGDVKTMAVLAQVAPAKLDMDATATVNNGNLVVVSGTDLTVTTPYLHGVALADFAVVCGNLPGVTLWAPVQDECSLGTLADNIDQSLFLDELYVNSIEFSYTTGANATENYGAETDQKTWLLNDGRFVNWDAFTLDGGDIGNGYVNLTLASGNNVASLSSGLGFLRKDADGYPAVTWYDASTNEMLSVRVEAGTVAHASRYVFDTSTLGIPHRVFFPTVTNPPVATDRLQMVYSADAYGTGTSNTYFTALDTIERPDTIGALRQGQVEAYIVADGDTGFDISWRLTGVTITSDLTREPLAELGHLSPYDRPLTLPIPITVTVDSTAGDLENWSKFAGKVTEFDADTLDDLTLADLMAEEDLKLVVKVYAQTDEEAGMKTGDARTIATGSDLIGQNYFNDGTMGVNSASAREYALKTIVVEHLKITDEGATLDMGANMTQTFGFRSTNDLYVVKGNLSIGNLTDGHKVRRNG